MIIKYRGGHVIPPNVTSALRYLGKVGVLSRETWNELFGTGTARWKRMQLQLLINKKLLRAYPCAHLKGVFVLGEAGIEALAIMKWSCVQPIPPRFIVHDETVARSISKLEERKICYQWFTERELRSQNIRNYLVYERQGETKYPDAIFKIMVKGNLRTVALEYERTGKDLPRYRSILWQYNGITNVSLILYIFEDEKIKNRIKKALDFQGSTQILGRLGFMSAEDWACRPETGTIEINNKVTSFDKLCDQIVL